MYTRDAPPRAMMAITQAGMSGTRAALALLRLDNNMVPPRVLVVDDEPAIRALVAKIVERAGLPVDTACDGADAIAKLSENDYAVIVLDLMMPNVDGYAFIDYLRTRNGTRPAVIVVSAGDSAMLRQLDGSMVHSIIRKPFDIDVLGDLVTAAAQSREAAAKEREKEAQVVPFPRSENAC